MAIALVPGKQNHLQQPHFGAPGTSIKNPTRSQQGVIQVSLAATGWAQPLTLPAQAWQSSYRRTPSISTTKSSPVSGPRLSPGMPSLEYEIQLNESVVML